MIRIADIEQARIDAGISQQALVNAAGVNLRHYHRYIQGSHDPTPTNFKRLQRALSKISGEPSDLARGGSYVFAAYLPVCALVARDMGVDLKLLHKHPPKTRATGSPEWMTASRIREAAVYLLNTAIGITQVEIARGLGVSSASICQICRKMEEKRDDPDFEELISRLESEVSA